LVESNGGRSLVSTHLKHNMTNNIIMVDLFLSLFKGEAPPKKLEGVEAMKVRKNQQTHYKSIAACSVKSKCWSFSLIFQIIVCTRRGSLHCLKHRKAIAKHAQMFRLHRCVCVCWRRARRFYPTDGLVRCFAVVVHDSENRFYEQE
jgi:hypothetical protein